MRKTKINNLCIFFTVTSLVFTLDFFIKYYLRTRLAFESIPVIKNIFHVTVVFNTGAAFGLLQGRTNLLIIVGLCFIVLFLLVIKKEKEKSLFFWVSCGLIAGGALSNMIDRIFLGFVVDYLDFRIWPVFNLSDTAITTGAGLLVWHSFWGQKHQKGKTGTESHP